MRALFFSFGILLAGCAPYEAEAIATDRAALAQGEMIVYQVGQAADESTLMDLGDPAGLGGTVLEGDPAVSARIDYGENGFLAGIFQATRGKVMIHFPFTEHATILWGEVRLTDEEGHSHLFKPGDAYLIKQGSNILWEVEGERVQKSFFNRVEAAESPGPMVVYRKGEAVPASELFDLGPPEGLGGTVLEGNPAISARIDYGNDGLLAGIFEATRGKVLIDFPFTEHATMLTGQVRLTDEAGATHLFKPGDSYLIKQGSVIVWDVDGQRVQKSFFNFTQP